MIETNTMGGWLAQEHMLKKHKFIPYISEKVGICFSILQPSVT